MSNRNLQLFDRLDADSRQRALTEQESLTLQQVQRTLLRNKSAPGMRRELLRRGIIA